MYRRAEKLQASGGISKRGRRAIDPQTTIRRHKSAERKESSALKWRVVFTP
jgi:hypothetical protein